VLPKRFKGQPEYVVNYFFFVAEEVREIMAQLGVRRLQDLIGRSDLLDTRRGVEHWKARGLDFSRIFYRPSMPPEVARFKCEEQDHGLARAIDHRLIEQSRPALERQERVSFIHPIRNIHRSVGAMLSSEVARRYGHQGLPDDTIHIQLQGTAGQSFGAFLASGITLDLVGDANDYTGKGLSGGRIIVRSPNDFRGFGPEHIIVGNTVLYGAIAGEAFFNGVAGERFAVRNSGATAVVEGVGDHGCEYMTGGVVVVLGRTGRNFGAGMSGGVAYVLDLNAARLNREMVDVDPLEDSDADFLREVISRHHAETGSAVAARLLASWESAADRFTKVMPKDYKRVLSAASAAEREGRDVNEAVMASAHG